MANSSSLVVKGNFQKFLEKKIKAIKISENKKNLLLYIFLGVKNNNDDARRILQRKTNHTDDPADILRAEHRIRSLKHRERQSRNYKKKNEE